MQGRETRKGAGRKEGTALALAKAMLVLWRGCWSVLALKAASHTLAPLHSIRFPTTSLGHQALQRRQFQLGLIL